MKIVGALVYTKDHTFKEENLYFEGERITDKDTYEKSGDRLGATLDGKGMYAVPGLIDIHLHGADGSDFCDASLDSLQAIGRYEAAHGVLTMCPATMSLNKSSLIDIIDSAKEYRANKKELEHEDLLKLSDLVGINLEGPYVNPDKCGAQNTKYIRNVDSSEFWSLFRHSDGLIKLVDIAPELNGALDFIKDYSKDVNISIAHTDCDYDIAKRAFAEGANHVTHLFNAMNGIDKRSPGPILAAKESGAYVELIADGVHIHPAVVRMVFDFFEPSKIVLISDSMEATGLSDGEYSLGGQKVLKKGYKAVLKDDGKTIAGSVSNLYNCLVNAVKEMGIPLEKAVRAATENPAASIGIDNEYGKLLPGYYGNVLLLDKDLNIQGVIHKGSIIA